MKVKFGKREAAEKVPGFVYCGREFGGFDESPLGNPYKVGADGTLPEVLKKYYYHLVGTLSVTSDGPVHAAMLALSDSSVLGCWCLNKAVAGSGPWSCHCDVIAHVWDEMVKEKR